MRRSTFAALFDSFHGLGLRRSGDVFLEYDGKVSVEDRRDASGPRQPHRSGKRPDHGDCDDGERHVSCVAKSDGGESRQRRDDGEYRPFKVELFLGIQRPVMLRWRWRYCAVSFF